MRPISLAIVALALAACDSSTDPSERALPIVYGFYPENNVTQADLYLASEDGRATRQVTSLPGVENSPAWSPDGGRIAFLRIVYPENILDPDTNAIYVVNADGSNPRLVADGPGREYYPAWSPDGRRLAFAYLVDAFNFGIAVSGLNPSEQPTMLPNTQDANLEQPDWHPDGTKLAFARANSVWTVDANGGSPTELASGPCTASSPRWSPDGSRLAFVSCREEFGEEVIRIVSATGAPVRIIDAPVVWGLAWSADGQELVYDGREERDFELYVVSAEGGAPRRITSTPGQFEIDPDWRRR